ncbi:MAG: AIM24 family protein [Clostridia bacterium]|nr:AIM24 family protein [Clostridia bacterium]
MKYEISGDPMPVVLCYPERGERIITERGAMSWMTPGFKMETTTGGVGKAFGRMFSGDTFFQNTYTAESDGQMIAFASSFPGTIRAVEITPDKPVICQKSSFLACTDGVELSVHFQKKVGAGLFGGEGFIMQKLSGKGIAFVELDGSVFDYDLEPGQTMLISTGNLAMADASVDIGIKTVGGVKNKLFGGEGFFNTTVTGPGHVVIQSITIAGFAATVAGNRQ